MSKGIKPVDPNALFANRFKDKVLTGASYGSIGGATAIRAAKESVQYFVWKIAQGKLNKFFKDNTLLPQTFVKDNSKTLAQYLDSVTKGLTVAEFRRISIG